MNVVKAIDLSAIRAGLDAVEVEALETVLLTKRILAMRRAGEDVTELSAQLDARFEAIRVRCRNVADSFKQ